MRHLWIVITLMVFVIAAGTVAVSPSGQASTLSAKKKCHHVTKTVHGKSMRVKVCRSIKAETSTPTPTATPPPDIHKLFRLHSVAVDSYGNVYASALNPARIVKLGPDGAYVTSMGMDVLKENQSAGGISCGPTGIFAGRQDSIYVTDGCQHAIFAFSASGELLGRFPRDPQQSSVYGPNDLQYLAVDQGGNVFASAFSLGRVERFSADGTRRDTVYQPSEGDPLGIALDSQGNLLVGLAREGIVVKVSPSGQELARSSALEGDGPTVRGVAFDSHGDVFASVDGGGGLNPADQIAELSPELKHLRTIAGAGTGPGQVAIPQGLTLDSQDNLYVAESFNNRIEKFSPSGQLLATWTGD